MKVFFLNLAGSLEKNTTCHQKLLQCDYSDHGHLSKFFAN